LVNALFQKHLVEFGVTVNENREDLDDFLAEDSAETARRPRRSRSASNGNLPTFVTVMAIIDLIVCGLRVPLLALSVIGIMAMLNNPQMGSVVGLTFLSLGAEALTAVCGLAAGIGMLMKKPWATIPGWIAAVCCLISLGSNIYTTLNTLDTTLAQFQGPQGEAARVGAYVGLAGTILFRLVLLGCYIVALRMFTNWIARNRTAEA
jgi:hypothetical protein